MITYNPLVPLILQPLMPLFSKTEECHESALNNMFHLYSLIGASMTVANARSLSRG